MACRHFRMARDSVQKLPLRRSLEEVTRKKAKNGEGEGSDEQDFVWRTSRSGDGREVGGRIESEDREVAGGMDHTRGERRAKGGKGSARMAEDETQPGDEQRVVDFRTRGWEGH